METELELAGDGLMAADEQVVLAAIVQVARAPRTISLWIGIRECIEIERALG